jgi:hypothetical protein
MRFKHTKRPGFLLGAIDFLTAGTFFLFYMPLSVTPEVEEILGKKVQPYWLAYILGIPDAFVYTLIWMARLCEDVKNKAIELGIKPHTSWKHMFWWNVAGMLVLVGPAVATWGFFKTLNEIETKLNRREK